MQISISNHAGGKFGQGGLTGVGASDVITYGKSSTIFGERDTLPTLGKSHRTSNGKELIRWRQDHGIMVNMAAVIFTDSACYICNILVIKVTKSSDTLKERSGKMAQIKIRGQTINTDIEAELSEFEWERPKWTSDKLIAASPFRYDRTPSFFVNLDGELAGVWGDSGAYDDEWASGGFVKLLAFLRNETYEESEQYLLKKYDFSVGHDDYILIIPKLYNIGKKKQVAHAIIERRISPYLTKRGISEEVQRQAQVGKSRHNGFVAIPWHAPDGSLANVKYRATRGKTFFYEKGATPIRELVYGADLYVKDSEDLVICEAEIDALSWRTAGFNAVAVGGVAFTKQQTDILRRLPFSRLIVAGDNDKAGARFNAQVVQAVRGRDLAVVDWRESRWKDANDVLVNEGIGGLVEAFEQAVELPIIDVIPIRIL